MVPRTPLFRPETYFKRRLKAKQSALGVFALYVVGSILLFIAIVDVLVAQIENPPSEFVAALNAELGKMGVIFVIFAVISLLFVAAIMHFLSGTGADGSFSDTLAVAGWSYAPNTLFLPIKYIAAHHRIQQFSFNAVDSSVFASQFEAVRSQATPDSILMSLVIIAWSVYILTKGTAGSHNVPVDETIWPALLIGIGAFVMQFLT